jgi:hypothetical protein
MNPTTITLRNPVVQAFKTLDKLSRETIAAHRPSLAVVGIRDYPFKENTSTVTWTNGRILIRLLTSSRVIEPGTGTTVPLPLYSLPIKVPSKGSTRFDITVNPNHSITTTCTVSDQSKEIERVTITTQEPFLEYSDHANDIIPEIANTLQPPFETESLNFDLERHNTVLTLFKKLNPKGKPNPFIQYSWNPTRSQLLTLNTPEGTIQAIITGR